MNELAAAAVAMTIGVVGTSTIHLSKGVMRLGLSRIRASGRGAGHAKTIYAIGILMNFTNPLWVILANRFAPTVFYTSMYGLGLLPLLLFSRAVLDEQLHRVQYLGVLIIVAGTLLVGAGNAVGGKPSLFGADRTLLLQIAVGWIVLAPALAVAVRRRGLLVQEVFFGTAAGGLAALEAVVKGVAQSGAVTNTLLPQTAGTWWLFGASFLGAAGAFAMIQWSYVRTCRASMMGAVYNVAYVTVPLVVTSLVVDGVQLGPLRVGGLALLALGVIAVGRPSRVRAQAPGDNEIKTVRAHSQM